VIASKQGAMWTADLTSTLPMLFVSVSTSYRELKERITKPQFFHHPFISQAIA
jgi:hypothetical protein